MILYIYALRSTFHDPWSTIRDLIRKYFVQGFSAILFGMPLHSVHSIRFRFYLSELSSSQNEFFFHHWTQIDIHTHTMRISLFFLFFRIRFCSVLSMLNSWHFIHCALNKLCMLCNCISFRYEKWKWKRIKSQIQCHCIYTIENRKRRKKNREKEIRSKITDPIIRESRSWANIWPKKYVKRNISKQIVLCTQHEKRENNRSQMKKKMKNCDDVWI